MTMSNSKRTLIACAVLAAAVFTGAFLLGRSSAPRAAIPFRRVAVAESAFHRAKPDTVVRWRERIVSPPVRAQLVATSTGAERGTVTRFCAPAKAGKPEAKRQAPGALAAVHDTAAADTGAVDETGERALLLTAGRYDGRALSLWGALSDGDGWTATYPVRGRVQWAVMGDSVLVQRDRFSGLKRWGERAAYVAVGAALGYGTSEVRR
jgi:hypothetical protein